MAIPSTNFKLTKEQQEKVLKYIQGCAQYMTSRYNIRGQLEEVDRMYMREVDTSIEQYKARTANKRGDPTKFQNIVIPVVMPQVENAVTYQSSVFLQGYPIFGVVSDPSNADAALQMDTIIGEQQIRGGWIQEYQKAFRNGFKYNLLATEVDWSQEISFAIETESNTANSKLQEIIWEGNTIKNLDLYNTIWDPRVPPNKVSKDGEFAGYTELIGRVALHRLFQSIPDSYNLKEALESGSRSSVIPDSYYFPFLNPSALILPDSLGGIDWAAFVGLGNSHKERVAIYSANSYQVLKFYARIIPDEFGIKNVPGNKTPQVWKFWVVNGSVIIGAERLTNAHGYLPILFSQAYDDGLGYQTKSLAVNVGPIQEITTAIANSTIASKRRAISDRMLFDPSRVSAAHLNNDNPTSRIPVRPSAFGDDLSKAVYPVPFNENLFQFNQAELNQFLNMSNLITGMNPARQGQFVKGNKTRREFEEIMANSSGRDQAVAMALESSLFTPTKEIIKANILQYQGGVDLYNREERTVVNIDPVALRKAMLVFKVSDGLIPGEKLIDGESLTVAFQTIQASPEIAQGFNIAPMFSYLMKMLGARIQPFEKSSEQLAYEQAAAQWMQAIGALAQAIAQNKNLTAEDIQEMQARIPPQPTPEQFNYQPDQQEGAQPNQSILEQVMAASAQQTTPSGNE